jgi:hypothetical protein
MGTQERKQGEKSKTDFREMTAAHIREPKNADFVEVMFLESARIYKVFKNNRKCKEILKRLREAVEKKLTVRVQLDTPHGDVIEDVG